MQVRMGARTRPYHIYPAPRWGIQPNAPRWGAYSAPPLPDSRTNRRSEAGEAAIESPEREYSNAH